MRELVLNLKAEYFHEIVAGNKSFEYRLHNDYWVKRLEGKHYDKVTFCLGYPAKHDTARRHTVDYTGYELQTITHPHFGAMPVSVFAIKTTDSKTEAEL